MPGVGDIQQPQGQWKIDKHIRNKSQRRSQHQHEHGPDRRSEKYPELPAGGVEPNGALKMLHANYVVNQQLLGRRPHHAGDTVNNQEKRRMPDLNRIGEKEYGPNRRDTHEQDLGALDDLPAIVSIGESAEVNGKQKKRCPVADVGKTGQNRRVELQRTRRSIRLPEGVRRSKRKAKETVSSG